MENQLIVKKKYLWKIKNFTREAVNKMADALVSDPFEILLGGDNKIKWDFWFYSNLAGFCEFSIHKEAADRDNFLLKIKVGILKSDGVAGDITCSELEASKLNENPRKVWGWAQFLKTDDIFIQKKKFLTDDTLTLSITLELIQGPLKRKFKSYTNAELLIAEYFDSKDFSDMTIICSDDRKIPAHRNILAGRSAVLKRMLLTDMIEKNSNEIVVNDVDGDTMLEIMRFIYKEEVEDLNKHAPKLLDYAEKYDIPGLKAICIDELINQLSDENIFENVQRANLYNDQKLMNACLEHIETNFSKLEKSEKWKELDHGLMVSIMKYMVDSYKRVVTLIDWLD